MNKTREPDKGPACCDLGGTVLAGSPSDFGKLIAEGGTLLPAASEIGVLFPQSCKETAPSPIH
jgi:hypothetical protein